jgi:hypothetical protein
MRGTLALMTLFLLLGSAAVLAGDEQSAKEGFRQVHQGMKKVTKTVDKNAKKGFKKVHKEAKKDVKTVDRQAKKGWKQAGQDVQKATKD